MQIIDTDSSVVDCELGAKWSWNQTAQYRYVYPQNYESRMLTVRWDSMPQTPLNASPLCGYATVSRPPPNADICATLQNIICIYMIDLKEYRYHQKYTGSQNPVHLLPYDPRWILHSCEVNWSAWFLLNCLNDLQVPPDTLLGCWVSLYFQAPPISVLLSCHFHH